MEEGCLGEDKKQSIWRRARRKLQNWRSCNVDRCFCFRSAVRERETVNYGLLVAKKIKKVGGREVCFARVMPMSKDTIYEVSMITIKKFEESKI